MLEPRKNKVCMFHLSLVWFAKVPTKHYTECWKGRCLQLNERMCRGTLLAQTFLQLDTCTPTLTAALFKIARTWKQPGCPSADEWIRKLWYIYTMEYYSAIKKNTFESVLTRWMKPEPIIQSEVNQNKKHQIQYINTYIWNLERW